MYSFERIFFSKCKQILNVRYVFSYINKVIPTERFPPLSLMETEFMWLTFAFVTGLHNVISLIREYKD